MDKNDIIEYVMHTPHNTNRAVLSSMLNQLTDGDSGGSWTVLTEESVTIVQDGDFAYGDLSYSQLIDADTIRVTFNGTEYECDKQISTTLGNPNLYGASIPESPMDDEWGEYPFRITSGVGVGGVLFNEFDTETAGTYNIKIEAPQSGGSSDFSTATVTVVNNTDSYKSVTLMSNHISNHEMTRYISVVRITDEYGASQDNLNNPFGVNGGESINIDVYVISGKNFSAAVNPEDVTVTLAGQAEESYMVAPDESQLPVILITGDCTITVGQAAQLPPAQDVHESELEPGN